MLLFHKPAPFAMIILSMGKGESFRRRRRPPPLRRSAALALAALALGGCSISMPLPSLFDGDRTGSINAASLASAYDPRDWAIAEPILAASLRASAPAEPASWSNPETGDHGEFSPIAGKVARDGQSCRAFLARIVVADSTKTLQGVGCPRDGGEVAVYDLSQWAGL